MARSPGKGWVVLCVSYPLPQVHAISGDKGQYWGRGSAQVHPNHKDGVFQFVFHVTNKDLNDIHPDVLGDIALDDISLSSGCSMTTSTLPPTPPSTTPGDECLEDEVSCQDDAGTCVLKSKLCDFVPDCPNGFDEVGMILNHRHTPFSQASCGSCTFEPADSPVANCGYKDMSSGSFQWDNVEAGASPSSPDTDHTTNSSSGHFMLVDHSDNLFGETAVLKGPALGKTMQLCSLQLWYHMSGDRAQTITVYLVVSQTWN